MARYRFEWTKIDKISNNVMQGVEIRECDNLQEMKRITKAIQDNMDYGYVCVYPYELIYMSDANGTTYFGQ